jgi:hypothetical protein
MLGDTYVGIKRTTNKKNYHWEIWQWECEYERAQKASVSYIHYVTCTNNLYDFLSAFPEKRTAGEFLITDLMDHLVSIQRERKYSHNSCARVGHDIAAFWNWMRKYKNPDLPNMRCDAFDAKRRVVPVLSNQQFLKLVDACYTQNDRDILREALLGTKVGAIKVLFGIKGQSLSYRWKRIRNRAGLPWLTMRTLHKSYRGMILRLGAEALTKLVGEREVLPAQPTQSTLDTQLTQAYESV